MEYTKLKEFYKNKKVFITGHTGFKGTWLCSFLIMLGAEVKGYGLEPETSVDLFGLSGVEKNIHSDISDIRNISRLAESIKSFNPHIVFHMAAQPLVRESYSSPAYTYDVNVMGTVNLLESARQCSNTKSIVNITTDKVYENKEWLWGYRENERLNGYDPYSNSKSCSELVTETYRHCFFRTPQSSAISTARAGNVIGGGDFAKDRIIPDCVRAALAGEHITVRNPESVRPYQHVLEPLYGYLLLAMKQYDDKGLEGAYNIGPDRKDCIKTGQLVQIFCESWQEDLKWIDKSEKEILHEANFLALDSEKIKTVLGYKPVWSIKAAVDNTVKWWKVYKTKADIGKEMKKQIENFMEAQEDNFE